MPNKQMWVKKRTSRGSGRKVRHGSRPSLKNIDRDIRKNQLIYSRYFLKLVLLFAMGLVWLRLGVTIGPISALPIGFILGLVIIRSEPFAGFRKFELAILLIATIASYFYSIGVVI